MKVSFPNLFQIATQPDLEVAEAFEEGQWCLEFRRQLNGNLGEEWTNLQEQLNGVALSEDRDEVYWTLEKSH